MLTQRVGYLREGGRRKEEGVGERKYEKERKYMRKVKRKEKKGVKGREK